MKTVRLGDYIELCDERNTDGIYGIDDVRGISIQKKLIETKADMNGVELSPYKILKSREFCYVSVTSRNGGKISLAMNNENKSHIVSSSYIVFRCKDESQLLPEYLFNLLSRTEFDRYSRFNSWGSARETFDWSEMCRVEIPLPEIEVQRELVAVYGGLKALAEENEALLQPLSDACQAFIIDCKKKYPSVKLGEYIEECDERNNKNEYTLDDLKGVGIQKTLIDSKADMKDVSLTPYKVMKPKEFCYVSVTSRNGGKISIAINNSPRDYIVSSSYIVFKIKEIKDLLPEYLFMMMNRSEFDRYSRFNSWGSARETFDWSEMCRVKIPLPPLDIQQKVVDLYNCYEEAKRIATEAREQLKTICPALVQKAAHSIA